MNEKTTYTVELTGPGLNLKRDLSEPIAHELLVWLLRGGKLQTATAVPLASAQSAPTVAPPRHTASHQSGAVVSVREFMDYYSPVRVPDKIACFALYLREHRNQREFSRDDVTGLFQEAAEALPKNLGRDLRWTQQIAWIAPSQSNPEFYYLTKKGQDAVLGRFPKELLAKTRQAIPPPTRRRNDASKPKKDSSTKIEDAQE